MFPPFRGGCVADISKQASSFYLTICYSSEASATNPVWGKTTAGALHGNSGRFEHAGATFFVQKVLILAPASIVQCQENTGHWSVILKANWESHKTAHKHDGCGISWGNDWTLRTASVTARGDRLTAVTVSAIYCRNMQTPRRRRWKQVDGPVGMTHDSPTLLEYCSSVSGNIRPNSTHHGRRCIPVADPLWSMHHLLLYSVDSSSVRFGGMYPCPRSLG